MDFFLKFSGRVLLLMHHNADHDAICASIALKEGLSKLNPDASFTIGASKGVSKDGRKVLLAMGEGMSFDPELDAELIILLDTSTLGQLDSLGAKLPECGAKIAVIDHHARHAETQEIADFYIVDEGASSTAELVYDLLEEAGVEIDEKIGTAILVGIFADTGHLRLAKTKAIHTVSRLLEVPGIDYDAVESLLEVEDDISRRMAHLKAAQRAKIEKVDGWMIATSNIGSFGASAARALVMLGADVAFVASDVKDGIQLSSRASRRFLEGTGIHLGREVMPRIGELIGGSGGGHAGAAGASGGKKNIEEVLGECLRLVKEGLIVHGHT